MCRFNRARKWVWELFEEPNKTKLGKVDSNNNSYCYSYSCSSAGRIQRHLASVG